MNYAILCLPYERANPLASWRSAGFADDLRSAEKVMRKPKIDFNRGDIFVIVETQYVSDIVANIKRIAVAVSDVKTVKLPTRPVKTLKSNWFQAYENYSGLGIVNVVELHVMPRTLVVMAYEWIRALSHLVVKSDEMRIAMESIRRWLLLDLDYGIRDQNVARVSNVINMANHCTGFEGEFRVILSYYLNIISARAWSAELLRLEIGKIYRGIMSMFESVKGPYQDDMYVKMHAIAIAHFPIQDIMLAVAEQKPMQPVITLA